jgi:hypothetical protein
MKLPKSQSLVIGLFIVVVVMLFATMPFGSFRLPMAMAASYEAPLPENSTEAKTCGGIVMNMVVLRDGGVNVYSDSDLENLVAITNRIDQKYFLCGADTREDGYVAIFFAGDKRLFVNAADVTSITLRLSD